MTRFLSSIAAGIMVALLALSTPGLADENEVVLLRNQVKDLNSQVSNLSRQVQALSSQSNAGTTYVAPSAAEGGGGLLHTVEDIQMSGYLSTSFNERLGKQVANLGGNNLRTFDNDQNTFVVGAAELDFQKAPNPEGGAGFRIDIAMGEDAETVDAFTGGSDADEFSLQQAYVEFVAPLRFLEGNEIFGDTVNVKMGRMVTLAGAEVIESKDNWNISRSLLFGFAIPATHTGLRAEYKILNDAVTTYWGVNNGWDLNVDNNQWKTLEWGFSANPFESISWLSALYFGPENAQHSGHKRIVLSNVLGWEATDQLSFKAEFTVGNERRVPGLGGVDFSGSAEGNPIHNNAAWWGMAYYVRYELTEKLGANYRIEFFRDDVPFRTGVGPATLNPGSTGSQSTWTNTFTLDYELYENLIARGEYRLDRSNTERPYNDDAFQSTLGAELIYAFA